MSKRDYYEVLGVDKNANEADIKKAYGIDDDDIDYQQNYQNNIGKTEEE